MFTIGEQHNGIASMIESNQEGNVVVILRPDVGVNGALHTFSLVGGDLLIRGTPLEPEDNFFLFDDHVTGSFRFANKVKLDLDGTHMVVGVICNESENPGVALYDWDESQDSWIATHPPKIAVDVLEEEDMELFFNA